MAGPDGFAAFNISGDPIRGIGNWTQADIVSFLQTGIRPDSDVVGSRMSDVIAGTSRLTAADRQTITTYLKSLPPT